MSRPEFHGGVHETGRATKIIDVLPDTLACAA